MEWFLTGAVNKVIVCLSKSLSSSRLKTSRSISEVGHLYVTGKNDKGHSIKSLFDLQPLPFVAYSLSEES